MIRAIIVDDEQPSVAKLEKLLQESGLAEIAGKFTEPAAALEFLKNNPVDAAFLDIEMPDLDGIELSNRIIDLQARMAVIFVTAYNQYAVEAFRLNALDYLMKPVTADRLRETLDRIVAERGIPMHPEAPRIQCFGRFKVSAGNDAVKFRTEKAEELLAFLIDRRGNFANRNEICDCLWEEFEGDRALIHFHTTLHYVKKALLRGGAAAPIEHDRGDYRLDPDGVACDYCRFQDFAARQEPIDPANIREYEEVAGLYAGDYLAGKEYAWAVRKRQILKDQYIGLLLEISGYYASAGDHQKTAAWMKTGLMHEPLHREINYHLLAALLSGEDRLAAGRYYELYRCGLQRELRQEPDDGFRKLMA